MKTIKTLLKERFNKWFVVSVIVVIIVSGYMLSRKMEHLYDYLFILGFTVFAIKFLYFQFYTE